MTRRTILSNVEEMDKMTATAAKQNFGDALARAASAPLGIERHGRVVAALVPPAWLHNSHRLDDRRRAREQQKQVELARLVAHQRVAIELLADPKERKRLLALARNEVQRWQDQYLCSDDYIQRWTEWLALPVADLARRMCSDACAWGTAMRQNSPFAVLGR